MKRMTITLILVTTVALSTEASAWSVKCQPVANNRSQCHSWADYKDEFSGQQKRIRLHWIWTRGTVDLASVCAKHAYGSLRAKHCRALSAGRFAELCRKDSKRHRGYCVAKRQFNPVR